MAERNDRFWHGLQFGADILPFREVTDKDLSIGGCLNDFVFKFLFKLVYMAEM